MNKGEIERILNTDLSYLDHAIDNKISSIDQITGKLSEKSDFLAKFQLMLQKQLSIINSKQQTSNQMTQLSATNTQHLPEKSANLQLVTITKQTINEQVEKIGDVIEDITLQGIGNVQSNNKYSNIRRMISNLELEIEDFKLMLALLRYQIQREIEQTKDNLTLRLSNMLSDFYQHFSNKLQQEIKELQKENAALKNIVTSHSVKHPLKLHIYHQPQIFNSKNQPNLKQINKQYFNQRLSSQKQNYISNDILNGDYCKTSRNHISNHKELAQYNFTRREVYQNKAEVKIPTIKPILVGVPPIENGFGVLKAGKKVIYRGMWKGGKFEGSGHLVWQSYTYEGQFRNGLFEGHGQLQINGMTYLGKFKSHKAEGEGTLEVESKKLFGFWKQNRLLKKYQ